VGRFEQTHDGSGRHLARTSDCSCIRLVACGFHVAGIRWWSVET
jgi:hypothetical protein